MKARTAFLAILGTAVLAACSQQSAANPTSDPAISVGAETIASGYAVKGQISVADLTAISTAGFRTVINNRPDGEEPGQPTSAELAAEAARLGLAYHHIPVPKEGPRSEDAKALADTLATAKGPILAFCRSGRRAEALKIMADKIG